MFAEFIPRHTFVLVELEAAIQEVKSLKGELQLLRHFVSTILKITLKVFSISTSKGGETGHQFEECDT